MCSALLSHWGMHHVALVDAARAKGRGGGGAGGEEGEAGGKGGGESDVGRVWM